MEEIYKYTSSIWYLLLNGKFEDCYTPWKLILDFNLETITIKKRNWFLIGVNEEVHAFRFIRRMQIDQHVFGSDITIKLFGGSAKIFCLKKSDTEEIKNLLINYNQNKKGGFVIS